MAPFNAAAEATAAQACDFFSAGKKSRLSREPCSNKHMFFGSWVLACFRAFACTLHECNTTTAADRVFCVVILRICFSRHNYGANVELLALH